MILVIEFSNLEVKFSNIEKKKNKKNFFGGKKTMFYKLKSEIIFKGFTMKEIAEKCGIPYSSWLRKMRDQSFSLKEAVDIKKTLGSDMPLEELFKWEDR